MVVSVFGPKKKKDSRIANLGLGILSTLLTSKAMSNTW